MPLEFFVHQTGLECRGSYGVYTRMKRATMCRGICRRVQKVRPLNTFRRPLSKSVVGSHFWGELLCQGAQKVRPYNILERFLTPGDQKVNPYHNLALPGISKKNLENLESRMMRKLDSELSFI